MNTNPFAVENNLHHTGTYFNQQDWYDENLGRGPGDPAYNYPGEPVDNRPTKPLPAVPF